MEARDSPAAAAAAAAADEDGDQMPDTAALAKEAAGLFQSRRYSECVEVLNELLQKKEEDPKVLHNIAVAEYFRDGFSDPRKLLDLLNKIKKRNEDLARSSGEQMEAPSSHGSNVTLGSKGSSTSLHQYSVVNNGGTFSADEFDTSIVTLNVAVTLYHLHEYGHALSILEPLYQNIEPIDETVALHVCLLLLDTALALEDASRAADVVQYLERSFGLGYIMHQGDDGTSSQNQCSDQGLKASAAVSSMTAPDASSSDSGVSANVPDNSLEGALSDEALEYETLISKLGSGAPHLARAATDDILKTSTDRVASAIDLKLSVQLYKVRLLLLTRNLKVAKREAKLAMNLARGRDSSTALLLKAQLEYARGNHRKAIKLLMTSSNRTEPGILSMLHNNLGCIFYCLRKHHTSSLFFCKALRISSSLRPEKPLKLSTFAQDKSLYILYNCGLQQLDCGNSLAAARCFFRAAPAFFNQPLLWLRFAECCLLAQEKGLLRVSGGASSGEDAKIHVVSSGRWRQLVVDDMNKVRRHLDCMGEDGIFGSDEQYRLSLPFARQCLLNALHILNRSESKNSSPGVSSSTSEDGETKNSSHRNTLTRDSKASNVTSASTLPSTNGDPKNAKVTPSSNTMIQSAVSGYEDMGRKENFMIKQAILGDLAYIELSLENPQKALSAARALRQLPSCSKMCIFLSHIYAAEALCHLNRPKEAAEQLSVYLSDGNDVQLPYSDEDRLRWKVEKVGDDEELSGTLELQDMAFMKPEEARGAVSVNLAIVAAVQGNLEQASHFAMAALSSLPNNPRASLAAIYVDLLLGKTQNALTRLKQCSHVQFYPAGVRLSSS